MHIQELPPRWQKKIHQLRKDCARYRNELRAAQAEIAALKAELDR
jgi:outer membrane murein-binding lipoprotein Lpp